ncbi:hypothetical protein Cgig2_024151 [Carnegiea gigantea]|uniref:Uncharacterized protein n=1 Tax=Carnegiea gigantea TaxID=171969 RepID=A0A9Q1K9U4_9CARY|nr:hypothetical protein Cgig2_024151 [Carnegiea gigantea]
MPLISISNLPWIEYEYMVILDLIKKGHPEPEKKIGAGVKAIEIRKSVDHILPLPENMKIKSDVNRALGGGGKKGGGGGGRGGGRGRGWERSGKSRRCLFSSVVWLIQKLFHHSVIYKYRGFITAMGDFLLTFPYSGANAQVNQSSEYANSSG